MADAQSPRYAPQSLTKKLGPWRSGKERHTAAMNKMLDELEKMTMTSLVEDVGHDDYDEDDDWSTNAADGASCPEALDSCWDNNSG